MKLYAKVGNMDDALKDFVALNLTNIAQYALGMGGKVGNQFIVLRNSSPSGPRSPSLFVFGGKDASNVAGVPSKQIL